MGLTAMQENELLESIRNGDQSAFNSLFDIYWPLLWQIAERKTGDTSDAKDLVQELFIDIWNRRAKLSIKGSIKTYLVAALYLKVFRYFHTKGFTDTHNRHFSNYLIQTGQDKEQVSTALKQQEQELGEISIIIESVIAQMPDQMRKAFVLKHYHQYSNSEIAAEMNISINTVKNHLKGGLQRLRKAGEGSTCYPLLLILWMLK